MIELLDLHLKALREAAELEIREIWTKHLDMKAAIAGTDVQAIRNFLARNDGRFNRSLGPGRGSKSIFEDEHSILAWVQDEYQGLVPTRREDASLYRLLTNKFGGVADISARFHLVSDTLLPLCIPILIDTAMNVECLFKLVDNCKKASLQNGFIHLTWVKERSRGRELSIDVPTGKTSQLRPSSDERISAATAVDCILALRQPLVRLAREKDRNRLLLFRALGGSIERPKTSDCIQRLSRSSLRQAWKCFRHRHAKLARLPIRLDQIRPTVLLKCALETNGDLLAVQRLAQHKSLSTTEKYIRSLPMAMIGRAKIRRVQNYIFVAAVNGSNEMLDGMGMNKSHAALLLAEARRMGFSLKSEVDNRPVDDADSKPIYRFVIADPQAVAEMVAFRNHITASQAQLSRDAPERWRNLWAPFAVFLGRALDEVRPDIRTSGLRIARTRTFTFATLV